MDPFGTQNEFNTFDLNDIDATDVIIKLVSRGRKCTTNVYGWKLTKQELKNHLKKLKTANGCNGTIKEDDSENYILLQGNLIEIVKNYLIENGVDENDITIKE